VGLALSGAGRQRTVSTVADPGGTSLGRVGRRLMGWLGEIL
jgi:hypothetical protein